MPLPPFAPVSPAAVLLQATNPRIASTQAFKFVELDPRYITWIDLFASININFKEPYYAVETVDFVEETKQAATVGSRGTDARMCSERQMLEETYYLVCRTATTQLQYL